MPGSAGTSHSSPHAYGSGTREATSPCGTSVDSPPSMAGRSPRSSGTGSCRSRRTVCPCSPSSHPRSWSSRHQHNHRRRRRVSRRPPQSRHRQRLRTPNRHRLRSRHRPPPIRRLRRRQPHLLHRLRLRRPNPHDRHAISQIASFKEEEDLEPGALAGCGLRVIRSDKARAFLAASLVSWVAEQGMGCLFIERGSPQ